jgi:hypothetical protein
MARCSFCVPEGLFNLTVARSSLPGLCLTKSLVAGEAFRRSLPRHALARDHFEPPIRSRPPVARVHETAIQLDCQRQVRLRQLFPVSLASFDEKHFLLPKFHFHAFRHFVNVIPHCSHVDPSPNRLILPEHRLSAYRTSGPRTSIPHTTTPEPSALSAPQPADIGPL